ncbi:MAG: caspase family protein, partial [Sandarakinorhabdus sp.]|nr:caspase family protein [Sandarakinorhabdus sp.]
QDVDAIFDQHLPAALEQARAEGRRLRLMFYAHGGLNGEADALAAARDRIGWWKSNGIYPIHFIWETGLAEVLGQMLERWQQGRGPAPRNLFSDHVSDPLIESFAHRAGGVQIWSAMKWSAMQASMPNVLGGGGNAPGAVAGGAYYVARQLAAFCSAHRDDVEVHAAGHSAGAIFHAHFLPCALDLGVPQVHSLHLLAPAVRVDLFKQQLAPRVGRGKGIAQLAMYTMADSYEKDDNCGGVYRKSLLYLIYRGLEPEPDQAVLGLERSVRADGDLKQLFGIGAGRGSADIIWSDNGLDHGRSATRSHTHGGFDDDPATMGSIVRRVLDKADADRIVELPAGASRAVDPWRAPVAYWSDAMPGQWSDGWPGAFRPAAGAPVQPSFTAPPMQASFDAPAIPPQRPMSGAGGGRRLALCVGIDTYPTAPLGGCVNDARDWADALTRFGFAAPRSLYNQNATRDAIMRQLTALVGDSRPGDVIVFQYAGHGTTVPDLDGDEAGADTPGDDEALCPYDFASGELLIDDDMRAIFRRLPDGVNLTCFFDCCHSGTITRMALGGRAGGFTPRKRPPFPRRDPHPY